MIDETRRPVGAPPEKATPLAPSLGEAAPRPGAGRTRQRHSVAAGRVAAAGIGIAAMLGLVANMQVADGSAKSASPATSPALANQHTVKGVHHGTASAPGRIAAAKAKRPIVLTPHAVVHTVGATSSGGYSGGSGYAAASAPAAAPVTSTSGSR